MQIELFRHKQVAYLRGIITIGRLHTYIYDYMCWSWRKYEHSYTLNLGFVEFNWDKGA
uniref:Uncharacterized protein n=1 Tax=viral metagenome TaxID=1070528 RepID=A0A6M3IP91_9ZZZZ